MKKTYIAPAVEITETQTRQMMAVSFGVNDKETGSQLVEEEASWDIWEN